MLRARGARGGVAPVALVTVGVALTGAGNRMRWSCAAGRPLKGAGAPGTTRLRQRLCGPTLRRSASGVGAVAAPVPRAEPETTWVL